MRLSPFGMDACCICDNPTTHAIPDGDEFLPYCADHAEWLREEIPDVRVYLYAPKEVTA